MEPRGTDCPVCGLSNLLSAQKCDCGYDLKLQSIHGEAISDYARKKVIEGKKKLIEGLIMIAVSIALIIISSINENNPIISGRTFGFILYIWIPLLIKGILDIRKFRKLNKNK